MKRYYILVEAYNLGPVKGDVMVWEGEYWNSNDNPEPDLLVRYLYDYDGFFFIVPKEHLVEFVSAKELEDPGKKHKSPAGNQKIWNMYKRNRI
tara:strand:- start:586 stop:864 length:279 start_codon:yes stop_codon:yes gene_type:complete